MPTSMSVAPGPAGAAFGNTSAVAPVSGGAAVAGADPLTVLLTGILEGLAGPDSASAISASESQSAAGYLGSSQVDSYVDRDASGAAALRSTGVNSC